MGQSAGFADTEDGLAVIRTATASVGRIVDGAFATILNDEIDAFGRELELVSRTLWAAQVRYAHEVDQRGLAAARSYSSPTTLLQQTLRISAAEAGRRVRAARATEPQDLPSGGETPPRLPVLAAAVHDGAIDPEHVAVTVATMRRLPPALPVDQRDEAERFLVTHASDLDPDQFRKVARHLEETIDPDGHFDEREPSTLAEFTIGNRSAATGLTSISGRLDDLGVETLRKAIDGLSAPIPTVDGVRDDRPATNRRACALVEVLHLALTCGRLPEHGGERPHITVTLDWDLLRDRLGVATLDGGGTLSAPAARRLLCDAGIIPAVLGGDGQVLDLGRTARTFNRATRRAIALRDRGCTFPGCSRPPDWCDAHHVDFWARDLGPTSYANGTLLCQYHHTVVHAGDWHIVFAADGVPEFVPPRWIDPTRRPRRNTLHDLNPPPDRG